ncbi:uncharacterized protein EV154DRAFT_121968 [Mucor mucedo]|uniref:uncharacterized protein n=1 Tax=Mucor mucedo TaxID=29922 RepID=UPI002220D9B9|nr:uncharacterized protein EV154DRAFT_121968 [Mucor mucedo]KAI7870693.1 hypothetical protein EV154DRAFT_121968 [Mucor mucedo]
MKNIESITINDIYVNYPDNVKTFFLDKISSLFHDTSGKKISGLFIFFTEEYAHNYEKLVLLKLIEKWLNDYGKQQKLFKLMAHDGSPNKAVSFRLVLEIKMFGGEKLVKKRIIESKKSTDPKILPLNSEAGFFKPIYFINIDLLPTTVNLQITHAGDTGHIKSTTENYQCDIQPLTNFISQPNLYDRSALCITYRMKLFIQNTFRKYLKLWSHPDKRTKVINTFVYPESKIVEKLLCKVDMDTMFSKKIALSAANGDNSVIVCHPGYFFFFIITYLYYLNKLIEDKMDSAFGNDWRDKNTAFAFSVEKKLLDDIFGSKETLNEMLFASGILHNNNGFRKAEICTYGEEILPAIQQKLKDADFKMKLYFIVAQLHQKHIQLTLHQVVKLSTPAEDAATIIIQDEILHIEDVYDTLCKNIWAALLSSNRIDYCLKHMNKGDDPHSLNSSEGYKAIYQRLKFYLMEVLSLSHVGIDMDYTYHLKITEECSCTIVLFLRDIIEKGIKPIIQNTATTIAASMTNSTLFGHYDIGFLFLLGDPFKLLTSSPLYIMYTAITQKAINIAIESKAKDLQGVVFQESIYQLLKQATSEKPYLYDRFIKGVLSQISTETYGVRFGVWGNTKHYSFLCMDCSKDGKNTVVRDGNFLIILQKGKPIPIAGVSIKLKFHMEDKSEEDDIFSNFYKHNPGKGVVAEFIKVQHSDNAVPGRYTLLEANSDGPKCEIHIDDNRSHNQPVIIDFKHLNYDYTLQLSARLMGFYTDLQRWNFKEYRIIGQPLTLAYIQSDTQVDSAKHRIKKREKIRNAANCTNQ